MRTTVTLDEDVMAEIRQRMREQGTGFKETLNDLVRRGLRAHDATTSAPLPTFRSGARPGVDLDKAFALASALEDEEAQRRLELRK